MSGKRNLSEQIKDKLYSMIMSGTEFKPGDQLPSETILAKRLGVSRATLREAIGALETQGILIVKRGIGTFVADESKIYGSFSLENGDSARVRLKDIYEARLLFEPELAALACKRATDAEINHILEIGALVEEDINNNKDRTESDQAFHRAIVSAAHNEFLLRLLPIINIAVKESILLDSSPGPLAQDTIYDHGMVMYFLKNRDELGVKLSMSIHILRAMNHLGLK